MEPRIISVDIWDDNDRVSFDLKPSVGTLEDLKRGIETLGRTICAYCGECELPNEDVQGRLDHIMTCEKRPEATLLKKAFEVEDGLFARIRHLTEHPYDPNNCETCLEISQTMDRYDEKEDSDEADKLPGTEQSS